MTEGDRLFSRSLRDGRGSRSASQYRRRGFLPGRRRRRRGHLAGRYREFAPRRDEVVHGVALVPEIDGRVRVNVALLVDDDARDVELLFGFAAARVDLRE